MTYKQHPRNTREIAFIFHFPLSRNYPPLTSGVKNLKNKVQRDLPLNRPCHSRFPHSGFLNVYFPPPLRLPSSRISIHLLPSVPPFSSAARGSKLDLEKRDSERALASGEEWNGIYSRRERERARQVRLSSRSLKESLPSLFFSFRRRRARSFTNWISSHFCLASSFFLLLLLFSRAHGGGGSDVPPQLRPTGYKVTCLFFPAVRRGLI